MNSVLDIYKKVSIHECTSPREALEYWEKVSVLENVIDCWINDCAVIVVRKHV